MKDIKCPNCGKLFHVEESTYQTIVAQVRNSLFAEELEKRVEEVEERLKSKEESLLLKAEKEFELKLATKDKEIGELKNNVTQLNGRLSGFDAMKKTELLALKAESDRQMAEALTEKEKIITKLEKSISTQESEHKLRIMEAENAVKTNLHKKEQEITELKAELNNEKLSAKNRESQLKEYHKQQLEDKQSEIDRLKDFKLRLSTKMVGETLEQHCMIQFSTAQSMGLYPSATFEKDNIVVEGSKGDFIFRDYIDESEYVSVMFEMKNEMDATATKHKNEDFLDKLDKDRRKKNCEYAVLVSMLEQGNELYDNGIVDKSHRYPKMLVIRPQFFLPVLRLLTEGARKGYLEKRDLIKELEMARNESIDLSKFEDKLAKVKTALNNNYAVAHKKFVAAYEGIDKAIDGLERQIKLLRDIKANFEASDQRLLKATEIGEDDLTIKKLTHGNPTVRKMIEDSK